MTNAQKSERIERATAAFTQAERTLRDAECRYAALTVEVRKAARIGLRVIRAARDNALAELEAAERA